MYFFKYITLLFWGFLVINCNGNKTNYGFSITTSSKSITIGDTIKLGVNNPKNHSISMVRYFLNDNPISAQYVVNNTTLGKKKLSAIVTFNGMQDTITKSVKIFNNKTPKVYTYNIVNTYPHDISSFTQGLEFYKDTLYESTGQKGQSKLLKLNYKTGEVLKKHRLNDNFFGEGLTILNDKIYQLTWQSKIGFVYNVNTFKKISNFKYASSKEGWGLCNDGKNLYKSDGTEKIWTINPNTLTEDGYIEAYTNKGKIPRLNELEWANGKIYANIYQKNGVAIINPKTGAVDGVINFKPLKKLVKQHDKLDVLNGIAYNPKTNTFFVTGKNWDKLFEVTITEK